MKKEIKLLILGIAIGFSAILIPNNFVYAQPYDGSIAVVTIHFEHGLSNQLSQINANMPDLPASIGPIVQRIGQPGYMTQAQLLDFQSKGFEIVSHSETHLELPLITPTPPDVLDYEIGQSKIDLQSMGFNIQGYVAPSTRVTPQSLPYINQNYCYTILERSSAYLVTYKIDYNSLPSILDSKKKFGVFDIPTFGVGGIGQPIVSLADAESKIDFAIANKLWIDIHFTGITDQPGPYNSTPKLFHDIISYIRDKRDQGNLEVMTRSQALGLSDNTGCGSPSTQKTTLTGTLFDDVNGNGVQDKGESGISGDRVIAVNLANPSTILNATTGVNGSYKFTDLAESAYLTQVVPVPAGHLPSAGSNSFTYTPNLAQGSITIVNFPLKPVQPPELMTIHTTVFNDKNGDGHQDPGESGLTGVQVFSFVLLTAEQQNKFTDSNGEVTFSGVTPEVTLLQVVPPDGKTATSPSLTSTSGLGFKYFIPPQVTSGAKLQESFGLH